MVLAGFNPRACEGATCLTIMAHNEIKSFNPRACEGATPNRMTMAWPTTVSIHAPVKARRLALLQALKLRWFQSTRL